jgi:hypothetical protein
MNIREIEVIIHYVDFILKNRVIFFFGEKEIGAVLLFLNVVADFIIDFFTAPGTSARPRSFVLPDGDRFLRP